MCKPREICDTSNHYGFGSRFCTKTSRQLSFPNPNIPKSQHSQVPNPKSQIPTKTSRQLSFPSRFCTFCTKTSRQHSQIPDVQHSQVPDVQHSQVDSVQRRVGNYHSNLWDDDFIQSLSMLYGESYYLERAERLIEEVKEIFTSISIEDGEPISLLQHLWMVDNVERLGISRHFETEIKSAIKYVYSYWSEKGIGCGTGSVVPDLNSAALGFRTLRIHGYPVSPDVLKVFQDQNGQFSCSAIQTEGKTRSVLNLLRASLIAFPGEKVMEEAEIFATTYLKEALKNIQVSSLSVEIKNVLEYGWVTNILRLEARNYIDVFAENTSPDLRNVQKLLELEKLEFNLFHSLQQKELKNISRWWKDSGFSQLTFTRHHHVEFYSLASCIATDPKHSAFRLGFAKLCYLGIVLDDIYDTFGKMNELELFTEAIKR